MVGREVVLALFAATMVACSGSSGSTWIGSGGSPSGGSQGLAGGGAGAGKGSGGSTAGSAGSGNASGSFAIAVDGADYALAIGASTPVSGDRFALIDVTLSNASVSSALSTAPANFSLRTDDSLVVLPSAASALLEPRCRDDLAVAAGGLASCRLAFEVSTAQTPAELVYDDQRGHSDTALVPEIVTPTTPCEGFASWSAVPSAACSDCVASSCSNENMDLSLAFECNEEVVCVSDCTEGCSCSYACLVTPSCRQLYDALWTCWAEVCTPDCV